MNNKSAFLESIIIIIIFLGVIFIFLYFYIWPDLKTQNLLTNACNAANGEEYSKINADGSQIQCTNNICSYIDKNDKKTKKTCNYDHRNNNSNKTPQIIINGDNTENNNGSNNNNNNSNNGNTTNNSNGNETNQNSNNNQNNNNLKPSNTTPSTPSNTTPSSPSNTTPSSPSNTTPSTPSNTTPSNPTQSTKTVRERIQTAYFKASSKGNGSVTLNNLKSELKSIFGNEGTGYKIIDNGLSWLIEILQENAIEIINRSGNFEDYIIPERDCGAVGNGIADDTQAFQTCLNSNVKNVVLTGTYLLTNTVSTSKDKRFFKGTIKCETDQPRTIRFNGNVRFNNTSFTSSRVTTGISPHKEIYQRTSNLDFVEVWGPESYFIDCRFENALRAIRGRISTGATVVPEKLYVSGSEFIDCKAPIQGFFAIANVENSIFRNNGDLYGGDHAIYIESFGSKELNVKNCTVETYNTDSGAAFQIYNKKENQANTPKITVTNTQVVANGIVSSDLANVTITNTSFTAQHQERYVVNIESGSVNITGSNFTHEFFFPNRPSVTVTASNSVFKRNKYNGASRIYLPAECSNCRFVNWGGTAIYPSTTIENSTFTKDADHVIGNYYVQVGTGGLLTIKNSAFKAGDSIAYKSPGTLHLIGCHFVNNIGQELGTVIEEGTIHEDIVN